MLLPTLRALDINLIHFCIILTANIEIASITPPVGFNLFVISSTTRVRLTEVARGAVPFVLAMLAGMLVHHLRPRHLPGVLLTPRLPGDAHVRRLHQCQFTRPVSIDAGDTALVVIDMQYASGSREPRPGRPSGAPGHAGRRRVPLPRIESLIIPNTQRLLAAWRAAGAPVIYLTVGARKADLSDAPAHLKEFFRICNNHAGSFENGIVEALEPMPGETIVAKNTMGAFASAPLGEVFDRLGVKTAVYVGVSTNNCVDTTAREAADRGYGSILVSDATGTCSDRMQDVTLESFQRLWGRVVTTEEAIGELTRPVERRAA